MDFIASKAVSLIIILLAIGVILVLWIQCASNGCTGVQQVKISPIPTATVIPGFGTAEIKILKPSQGESIASPITITGKAIPDWYIGGAFTVRLLDENGHGLAYAQAVPDSVTPVNGFISFTTVLPFFSTTKNGTLLFGKNQGSGLPDFPTTVAMPIAFSKYAVSTPTPIGESPSATPQATVKPEAVGILKGTMTIGPICPVEQSGASACKPSVKMFADRVVSIFKKDKTTLVTTVSPDANGAFSVELKPGEYYITMVPQIMGSITGVPTIITITKDKISTLSIAVDTGIRTPEQEGSGSF